MFLYSHDDAAMLLPYVFSGLNLFLHAGQTPWIRDWLEKNWQKDSYGRKDGQKTNGFHNFH